MTSENLDISVVIPVYNEEDNLRPLVDKILEVLGKATLKFEIILVDDGSTDSSGKTIDELASINQCIRCVHLEERSGQTSALDAGFRTAHAPILTMMDADLQYDPRDIVPLLDLLRKDNLDLVCGWRHKRQDSLIRRASGAIANRVRNSFTHDGIHDTGCTLKVFRGACLDKIKLFKGMHRFLPVLFQMEGFQVGEAKVNHRHRTKGKSKYTIGNRLFVSLGDLWAIKWMKKRRLTYRVTKS